jgi:hypothetical protein
MPGKSNAVETARQRSVESLLKGLEKPEGEAELEYRPGTARAKTAYDGLAVGRTEKHVHLAVETGVLAIPIEEIFEALPISRENEKLVRIIVNNPHEIEYVKGGDPLTEDAPPPDPTIMMRMSNVMALRKVIVCYPTGIDTATITAGRPDATDDTIVICCW